MNIFSKMRFNWKRLRLTNIFYKFLLSYILLILIPIIGLGSLSYLVFSSSIQKEAQQNNALILNNISEALDQELSNTKNMMYQTVLKLNGSDTDYIKLQEATSLMSRILNTDKFIDDIFVYYPDSKSIIRSDGLYQADYFFQNVYNYKDSALTDWVEKFSRNDFSVIPAKEVMNKDRPMQMTSFLTSFPLFNERTEGTLVVLVNTDKLESIINRSLHGSEGQSQILIINDHLQTIASSASSQNPPISIEHAKRLLGQLPASTNPSSDGYRNVKENDVSLSYNNSRVTDWKYVTLTSIHQISSQADTIRLLTLLICFVLLIVGVLISILISRNFTKPIYEIMNIFKTDLGLTNPTRSDEFQVIKQHLRLIMNDHQELAKHSESNQKLLKDYYVKSIILGDDPKHTDDKAHKLETIFVYPYYTVIVIRILIGSLGLGQSPSKAFLKNQTLDAIEGMLREQDGIVGLLTNTGGDHISILANYEDPDLLKRQLELIKLQFDEGHEPLLWIGVGNAYGDLLKINQSYQEACSSLQYRRMNAATQIIYYADCIEILNQPMIPIPVDIENQLTLAIIAGDQLKVTENLNLLFERLEDKHPFNRVRRFGQDLLRIIDKLIYQNQLQKAEVLDYGYDLIAMNDTFTVDELKEYLQSTFQKSCIYFQARTENRDKRLEEDLVSYIYQYYDQEISLDSIAVKFNLNPKYVSRFFKEQIGVNFLDFVNQYRVMKAKEMLLNAPHLHINKIANQVGISNVNTFISVFKKYEGVTPGKYREIAEKSPLNRFEASLE